MTVSGKNPEFNNWQAVQDEVLRRLHSRQWKPGELIPNEVELAQEFGCARPTVNRALRALADAGLLDRRRKAGTRVAVHPVRKATLEIPIIRLEIEDKGQQYGYKLLQTSQQCPSQILCNQFPLKNTQTILNLNAIHYADQKPYMFEVRWINLAAIPQITDVDFTKISANEWLVMNAPFTTGDISFSAAPASVKEAIELDIPVGNAVFIVDRTTWYKGDVITSVRQVFFPGYAMNTII